MTNSSTLTLGKARTPAGWSRPLLGVLITTCFLGLSVGARADVFGGVAPAGAVGQSASVADRVAALEKELKELKEKGGVAAQPGAQSGDVPGSVAKPRLRLPAPPPGMEGLPGKGVSERDRLLVEKELTYEVIGEANGMLIVRDGEQRYVMSPQEFKSFEKSSREKAIKKLKVNAVGGEGVSFPELQQPNLDLPSAPPSNGAPAAAGNPPPPPAPAAPAAKPAPAAAPNVNAAPNARPSAGAVPGGAPVKK